MLNYGSLENELVGVLNTLFGQLTTTVGGATIPLSDLVMAVAEPETDKEARSLEDYIDKNIVVIKYLSSQFEAADSMNQVSLQEDVVVGLIFLTKSVRKENELYALFNVVKARLIGYRPEHCKTRMVPLKLEVIEHQNLGIKYMLSFKTSTQMVQAFDDNGIVTTPNTFTKLNLNYQPLIPIVGHK
jgi:hypothetical protein